MNSSALSLFHPLVADWFRATFGSPSDIQARSWPEIAAGKHVLVTAPTGSGKTLTAFLWALNQLIVETWAGDQVRVLYVSPLKALNNDVHRNLNLPLTQLRRHFQAAGCSFPLLRVQTRSGDTPQDERRRMLKQPPEILITTPESLNILISSRQGRRLLLGLKTVILDEIHAVISAKRGTHLMTAVDRLVPLCGEFQRIALSATVRPMEKAAEFIGGFRLEGAPSNPVYVRRNVNMISTQDRKRLEVSVHFPQKTGPEPQNASIWPALVNAFKTLIQQRRSTLFFANSRRLSEKVARLINEGEPSPLAYSHHGSLSKEIRLAVEQRLKNHELRAIVATNSLELGIDIGNLDQVALIQTPLSISSAVQRIGRSGHQVGAVSRGILFPTHGRDLIHSAVMARCITDMTIEAVSPPECPLDVLAQVLLAMCAVETWDLDALFAVIRTNAAYQRLTRRGFDLVLDMLAGRYADTRIRELNPRITLDRTANTVHAKSGSLSLVYLGGGTIPDRGYFDLRLQGDRTKIGELDEEFVWERHVGETFALGIQTWRIQRITANDVEVVPAESRPGIIPFWRAEARNRDFHFSEKIGEFLATAEAALGRASEDLENRLVSSHFMTSHAARELIAFLKAQKEATRASLPHRRHLLVEHYDDPLNRADKKQVILHTLWGGRINRPFAVALSAAWERLYSYRLEVFADDDAVLVMLPHRFDAKALLQTVHSGNVEALLRERLESTGLFSACFRENAGRALLLPKMTFRKRMPLWLNRLRSKKLMDAVMKTRDFPLLLETWRTCLQDEFDLPNLKMLLDELAEGRIAVSEAYTSMASPFAAGLIWRQTNTYMYKDDTPEFSRKSALADDLIQEAAMSACLRPSIPARLGEALEQKLQRTAPGYSPGSAPELLDWVRERVLIPIQEWEGLLGAIARDHDLPLESLLPGIAHRLIKFHAGSTGHISICARENLPRLFRVFSADRPSPAVFSLFADEGNNPIALPADIRKQPPLDSGGYPDPDAPETVDPLAHFLSQWLAYYGPIAVRRVADLFGLDAAELEQVTATLVDTRQVVVDRMREQAGDLEICDQQNLEILLRMMRKAARPSFKALAVRELPLFLAAFQGLTSPGESLEDLQNRLEQLFGFCAAAGDWEQWILPSRLRPYFPAWLDSLMQSFGLCWFGAGKERIGFSFEEDLALFQERSPAGDSSGTEDPVHQLIPKGPGHYGLLDVARHAGIGTEAASTKLWDLAWQGRVGNDGFAAIRGGILSRFTPQPLSEGNAFQGRRRFNRWKATRPLGGNWFVLSCPAAEEDEIEQLELNKERTRQLLRRYGILFRELLNREPPLLQWRQVFKSLRLMELSGEVLSGRFFEGIGGLQFISHDALRFLRQPLPGDAIFWMNAVDPASACGLNLPDLKAQLPPRHAATFLVFHGPDLVMTAKRNGLDLDIRVPPDSNHLPRYLSMFKDLLGREFNPRHRIRVERINSESALDSPYGMALKSAGFVKDHKGYELRRQYGL